MSALLDSQMAFVLDIRKLLAKAEELGYQITFGEAQRTIEQQQLYVKSGRSKTMDSEHLNRRAMDFNIFKNGKLCNRAEVKPLGDFWESLNPLNRWGGNWRGLVDSGKSTFIDVPHFERRG